jgi:hypothetical protein
MKRTFGTFSVDERTTLPATRKVEDIYRDANTVRIHHSETEDGCLHTASITDPINAEELPALNNEDFELYASGATKPVSAEVAAKIAHQLRIGQGPRNAKRVEHARKQAFLQTEQGEAWKIRKHAADNARIDILIHDQAEQAPSPLPAEDDDVFAIAFS